MSVPAKTDPKKGLPVWVAVVNAVIVVAIVLATMFLGVYGGVSGVTKKSSFAQGTSVDGIDIGGMTLMGGREPILQREREELNKIRIELTFNGAKREFTAAELGVTGNASEVLDEAYDYNKKGDALSDFNDTQNPREFFTSIFVDKESMVEAVGAFLNANASAALSATASFDASTRTFYYTDEKAGVRAYAEEVCAALESRVYRGDYSPFEVAGAYVETLKPEVTRLDLEKNTALIAQYQTIATDNKNRNINIDLMCQAVNGVVLQPGETLSINELVGQRTLEKGFTIAPAIVDGQLTDDVGGGICQLAGTLYNAALLADMEIVERVHHTWPSDYLPIGLDATLNWNNKDLKIKNRSEHPLYLVAELKDCIVSVEIYGEPLGEGVEIVIENRIVKETEAAAPQIIYTDKLPAGTSKTQVKSRPGYEVLIYRHYLKGDAVYESELISHDHFRAVRGTLLMGTSETIK